MLRHCFLAFLLLFPLSAFAAPSSVYLEDLTSPEIAAAIKDGYTTAIIPTGGTEQNGPHMALGKHNVIVHYTSGEIARKLGNALVAPVITYTPEGDIDPPQGHMRFAGTISLSPEHFSALLEDTARSLKQHGFTRICFIGDSGPNQMPQQQVAQKLNEEWEGQAKVLHVGTYYDDEASGQMAYLLKQGFTKEQIGSHATITDTSEVMALRPVYIRDKLRAAHLKDDGSGALGDSAVASAKIGRELLALKIAAAVKEIQGISKAP